MSEGLAEAFDKDRRLVILRLLSEQDDYSLSASMLTKVVRLMRHRVYDDTIEDDLKLLARERLVSLEPLAMPDKTITIATLTKLGRDVVAGRPHHLIAKPSPRD